MLNLISCQIVVKLSLLLPRFVLTLSLTQLFSYFPQGKRKLFKLCCRQNIEGCHLLTLTLAIRNIFFHLPKGMTHKQSFPPPLFTFHSALVPDDNKPKRRKFGNKRINVFGVLLPLLLLLLLLFVCLLLSLFFSSFLSLLWLLQVKDKKQK